MPITQSRCILTFQVLASVNSGKNMQWLEACCWTNEWRNGQFNKQTNETSSLKVEGNWRSTGTPDDPTGWGSISSMRHKSPGIHRSVLCPLFPVPFPKSMPLLSLSQKSQTACCLLCMEEMCDFTVSMIFLTKSKWCPMWLRKKCTNNNKITCSFFLQCSQGEYATCLLSIRLIMTWCIEALPKSVWHSLHTCIKCNAIRVWRLSNWTDCYPGANAELQCLFPWNHKRWDGESGHRCG